MSAVLEAREPSARYLDAAQPTLVRQFDLLAMAPAGVRKLRALIQTLAVQGKLVAQYPGDEPASALLTRLRTHKARMVSAGDVRAAKLFAEVAEEEQPFSLPATWTWTRFGDVTINRDGERIPVSSDDREQRAKVYDYYGASGVIDKIDGYLFDKTLLLIGEDGANLLNRSTPIAFLAHGKYWVNNHAHVIDTIEPGLMRYLELFINAISLEPYVTGTAQPKMNQAKLNNIVVALPPLAEQARIVARVDELMRLCDALEAKGRLEAEQHSRLLGTLLGTLTDSSTPEELAANWQRIADHFDLLLDRPVAVGALEQTMLQLAVRGLLAQQDPSDESASELVRRIRSYRDEQVKSGLAKRERPFTPLSEADLPFELPTGWEWIRFDDLIEPAKPISYGVLVPGPDIDRGVPFVRIADLSLTDPPAKPEKSISTEVDAPYRRTRLEGGEILMGVVGSIGKLGVAPPSWAGANIARAICRIVPVGLVDYGFVLLLLQSEFMRDSFAGDTRTLAQPTLNVGLIRSSATPLPPIAEQARIVARVTEIRRLCADLRQRLDRSSTTQASLADALIEHALSA